MPQHYVYGPVHSWRSGLSLGIDPIGDTSTCSFNCAYCQLGKIQKITTDIKTYIPTEKIISDLKELEVQKQFRYEDLDVITFAGSGEPTLAENLAEIIRSIRSLYSARSKVVPISILTNATMLNDKAVRERVLEADQVSLKLDAPNNEILRSINQPAPGISIEAITSGISQLKKDLGSKPSPRLQLQIMFMPKFIKTAGYIESMAELINQVQVYKIQINTPTRPKPVYAENQYWIETRGNHYAENSQVSNPDYVGFTELPVISKEEAFMIEDKLRSLIHSEDLEIINVYRRENEILSHN